MAEVNAQLHYEGMALKVSGEFVCASENRETFTYDV
jgi:hypothetical protein